VNVEMDELGHDGSYRKYTKRASPSLRRGAGSADPAGLEAKVGGAPTRPQHRPESLRSGGESNTGRSMEEAQAPCRSYPAGALPSLTSDRWRRRFVPKATQLGIVTAVTLSGLLAACSFSASVEAGGAKSPAPEAAPEAPPAEPEAAPAEAAAAPKANVKVSGAKLEAPGGIFFQPNDAQLLPGSGSEAVLAEIKTYLEQSPRVTRLRIEGHTNNTRPPEQSLQLSGQRALAVKQWLLTNGINPGRLLAVGFGETQPIGNNADPAGAAQNERIQFRIAELDGKPYLGSDPLAGGTEFP
jgi:outer membrane protein OmpA-like peptidoglycan-associated protein